MKSTEAVFTKIAEDRLWGCEETPSGPGSSAASTAAIVEALPGWFRDYQIHSVSDLGCGDFNWMKAVDLGGMSYDGYDVVRDLVEQAASTYGRHGIRFHHADILNVALPRSDLFICKDVLIHFPTPMAIELIQRINAAGASFFAANTYPGFPNETRNLDVGQFQCLDLEAPPFCLGEPLQRISVPGTRWKNKLFCLWKFRDA